MMREAYVRERPKRNSKQRLTWIRVVFRRSRFDVTGDLVRKLAPSRETPAERLDETSVTLPAFDLSCCQSCVRQRRRAGEPEANKHRERLIRDGNMPFEPLDLPRHAIETAREGRLQAIGAVWRQMRGERCLHDQGLRHAFARGIVG